MCKAVDQAWHRVTTRKVFALVIVVVTPSCLCTKIKDMLPESSVQKKRNKHIVLVGLIVTAIFCLFA
jgi:hypothetical protein